MVKATDELAVTPEVNGEDKSWEETMGRRWAWPEESFMAGCIGSAASFWREHILADESITEGERRRMLSWIEDGVDATSFMRHWKGRFANKSYDSDLPQPFAARNHPMPEADLRGFATLEVRNLLATGAIAKVATKPTCVLPLGVVRGSKKLRLILDARYTNSWCTPDAMSFDTLRTYQQGIHQGDCMISLDFKSGYHHVPLDNRSAQYFGFKWRNEYFTFNVLPFGWNVAPAIFNTLSTKVAAFIRQRGIHTLVYLDDFSFCFPGTWGEGQRDHWVWVITALMYLAGYTISKSKCTLTPTTSLILLGLGIDTVRQKFWVPEEKITTLMALIATMRASQSTTVLELQRVVGKAESLSLAVPPISIFLRSSYDILARAARLESSTIHLTEEILEDLETLAALKEWENLSSWTTETHVTFRMETDASGRGWGGALYLKGERHLVGGAFKGADMAKAIHIKELLAVQFTLEALGGLLSNCYLDLYTDNTIVEYTILRGSAKDPEMRAYSKKLLHYQITNNVIVRVLRISTTDNVTADGLSRFDFQEETYDRNDHKLHPSLFAELESACGKAFTLDVCASPGNTQVDRFISRYPVTAEGCVAVNVFTFDFKEELRARPEFIYANPPWPLIAPLWKHLRVGEAQGVMIVPSIPTKGWFGEIMRSAKTITTLAKRGDRSVFLQPSTNYEFSVGPVPWDVLAVEFDFSPSQIWCPACKKHTAGPTYCGDCGTALPVIIDLSRIGESRQRAYQARTLELAGKFMDTPTSALVSAKFTRFMTEIGMKNPVLTQATPSMVVSFLVSKDDKAYTAVHGSKCHHHGTTTLMSDCAKDCSTRSAATAVNATYGTLRGIFREAGLTDYYDPSKRAGNPCNSKEVRNYVKSTQLEQLVAGVQRIKSTLFDTSVFYAIMGAVIAERDEHIENGLFLQAAKAAQHALLYAIMWHTGLRHADASNLLVQRIHTIMVPGPHPKPFKGWHIHVGLTKTSKRSGKSRILIVEDDGTAASPQSCLYVLRRCLEKMSLQLQTGLLFASISLKAGYPKLGPNATTYKAAEHFLEKVKEMAGVPSGVKLHSFHGSKAAMDMKKGASTEQICEDMDWSIGTLHEYLDGRPPFSMTALAE
jgi:hypothetical protein